jgi:uncharacterized protein YecE (DUF72 family)
MSARKSSRGNIRIGISGWRYAPWRGKFYPRDLPQRSELAFASGQFPSIELNGSFYSLQRPQSYADWYEQTPPGFVFAIKGSRYITHIRRLSEIEQPLAAFFAQGLFNLRDKLGPLLWQLPPSLRFDESRLDRFLALLPRTTEAALKLARRRPARMAGRVRLAIDADRPLRHALEVRHDSFRDPAFIQLLHRHGVAGVFADTAGRWPYFEDLTADFVYLRLHGDEELYASGYTDTALDSWARKIDAWSRGRQIEGAQLLSDTSPALCKTRDVYCYFDNDVKVRAPVDAHGLSDRLGLSWQPAAEHRAA